MDEKPADTSFMYLVFPGTTLVGRAYLSSVFWEAFQSAKIAYAVDRRFARRGIATASLRELSRIAFTEQNLHCLQGEVLTDIAASRHVVENGGFNHCGTAPDYLRIDGPWQTHELHQLPNSAWDGSPANSLP